MKEPTLSARPPDVNLWIASAALLWVMWILPPAALAGTEIVRLRSAGNINVSYETGRRQVVLTDQVVFDYAGYHMNAGRLTLDETVGRAWAEGGLTLTGPVGRAEASEAWFDIETDRFVLQNISVRAGTWSARAGSAEIRGERIELKDAHLTVCPMPNPLYSLRAKTLTRESPEKFVARAVTPYFYAVPFFYLPKYTYELERTEEGTLVPSQQGLEFRPGRGNFTGLFLKTFWRKRFLNRKLLMTSHFDYFSNPGPAVGQEIEYRSKSSEHYSFAYFTRQRNINHDDFTKTSGRTDRWRLWQTWAKTWPNYRFRSFVNETSDSVVEDDYRFNFDERRLREREINTEFVADRPLLRAKILGERLRTLDIGGSSEYRLERRVAPGVRILTFPLPVARIDRPLGALDGLRFYASADMTAGRGTERSDRKSGQFGDGHLAATLSAPFANLYSATLDAGIRTDYHRKKISGQTQAATNIADAKFTIHRPWNLGRLRTSAGFSFQKAMTNESIDSANEGFLEEEFFVSIRHYGKIWKTVLDGGYDFRKSRKDLSVVEFQTRADGSEGHLAAIARYDPVHNRFQSVYTGASLNIGEAARAGMGFQTVHTDSQVQIQFAPYLEFKPARVPYRFGFAGSYDAELTRWRDRRVYVTREFKCVETTFDVSRTESDLQFNFRFRLAGFERGDELFQKSNLPP